MAIVRSYELILSCLNLILNDEGKFEISEKNTRFTLFYFFGLQLKVVSRFVGPGGEGIEISRTKEEQLKKFSIGVFQF